MRKLSIVILIPIVILALVASIFGYYWIRSSEKAVQSPGSDSLPKSDPEYYTYERLTYFVPITSHYNINLHTLNFDQIQNLLKQKFELHVLVQDWEILQLVEPVKSLFAEDYPYKNFIKKHENYFELRKALYSKVGSVGIVRFDLLEPKVKALAFDGVEIFDRDNLSRYRLFAKEALQSSEPKGNTTNLIASNIVRIGHTGSIIGSRGTKYTVYSKFNKDFKKVFESTKALFDRLDFVSATLEASVLNEGFDCYSCTTFVAPERLIDGVKYSGIDLVSTASNHILDGGYEALQRTYLLLDEAGIKYLGSSIKNNDEAGKPVLVEVNGLKIAYLAINDTPGLEQWATEKKGGAASISDWVLNEKGQTVKYEPNEARIKYFLDRAKALNPDLIVVLPHWGGQEYTQRPTSYTRNLAHLLMKHGADIIVGDHPHWVQEMEFIGDKPVWYCVGNYVFDQTWSEETRQGISVELIIYDKKLISFKSHPHYTRIQGVPQLVNANDKLYEVIQKRMWDVSKIDLGES